MNSSSELIRLSSKQKNMVTIELGGQPSRLPSATEKRAFHVRCGQILGFSGFFRWGIG